MDIHSLTSQPSDERSYMGNNSLMPGSAGGFHGGFGNLSNVHPMPVPPRSISPGSSFGGGSIAGSAVSEVPPLLPLFPLFQPKDRTMPFNHDLAASARQQLRPFDSTRAAYSEGVPQRTGGWGIGSSHPLSQSHSESRFGGGRPFDPAREASRSPTSMGKKQKTDSLLSEGLRQDPNPRDNYDRQMLSKIGVDRKLARDGSNLSTTTSVGSPRSALSAGLASYQQKSTNGLNIPYSASHSNPLTPWQGDRSNPELTAMAFRPTEYPPVFPAPVTGAPPPSRHHAQRSFEHDRMSMGGNEHDFGDEDRSRRGSRSRNSQGFDDGDDLQMDGFPPSHVSNRMEGLTLENQTPPRTPNSISGQRQQRGSKRRASSPSEGSGSTNRRSPVGGYTPRLSPNASLRSQGPGAFSSASRGPGSSISTSTSSASTGWSYNASNAPSAASSIHSGPISHVQSIPFSQPPQSEQGFESKSLTPRSFVTLREREIQPAKTESNELATAPRAPGRFNGFSYICDCCPKKPKKFETRDELEQHESEKQHKCAYCDNKFKNKNEAERHQNSLHLRKHSWSCAALTSGVAAFHPSKTELAEICGYCGQEFPLPANWEARMLHLTTDHKFGECNQAKKFFRADHFRQHLKHSHSGTSGKWTNLLETACMRDEGRMEPPGMAMDC